MPTPTQQPLTTALSIIELKKTNELKRLWFKFALNEGSMFDKEKFKRALRHKYKCEVVAVDVVVG